MSEPSRFLRLNPTIINYLPCNSVLSKVRIKIIVKNFCNLMLSVGVNPALRVVMQLFKGLAVS